MRKFKEKLKKTLSILLIIFLVAGYSMPSVSFAEEITPDTSQQTINNSATLDNSTTTASDTGNNSINPTPTPVDTSSPSPTPDSGTLSSSSPSPTPTPDPSGSVTATNDASVNNNISSGSISGENSITATGSGQIATDSASVTGNSPQNSTPNASINTGNATSVTTADNSVNSTSVNSSVVNQTINLFIAQDGNINLNDPFTIVTEAVQSHPEDPVVNVSVTNVNNYAYLSNNIVSFANSGQNSIAGATTSAVINTGNAYSIVSLVNKVNFTIVNSQIHVITINLFGNLNGNIVLPDFNQLNSSCATCGMSLNASNSATVTNNVNSQAFSGQNGLNGSGSIVTGDANSTINLLNLINSNFLGVNINGLYINVLGTWDGNFIGWGNVVGENGGASLTLYETGPPGVSDGTGCPSCTGNINITNNAIVENNVTSTANTGGNTLNGKGSIITGNAFSLVSLVNFINTNFINSSGFFGFVNVFGNWIGDIGGKSQFDALNVQDDNFDSSPVQTSSTDNSNNNVQEEGGQLSVTNKNNVGAFVYPGDTVTFFVTAKNTGTGRVYGAKANLYLIYNGQNVGGTTFDLGDIDAGKGKKLTTGFVLSKTAPGGEYIARVDVIGNVGPDNGGVSATADSFFTVFGNRLANAVLSADTPNNPQEVLGAHYPLVIKGSGKDDYGPLYALITVIFAYIALRGIRERDKFIMIFGKRVTLEERMKALKIFLI